MSGTGNTYRACCRMSEEARKRGITTRMIPVEEAEPEDQLQRGPQQLVGFAMPTHGFTAPWPLIRLALRMPRAKNTHAFVVATRAGTRFFSRCFPGMEGTALYLIALILFVKGFRVRGVLGLDMPSNWMSLHPGLHPKNVEVIVERARTTALTFIDTILDRRRHFRAVSFVQLFLGILLLPLSFGYLVVGRFIFAKLFFANFNCNGCAICEQNCPNQAIIMKGEENPRPYWTFKCESCMRCMAYCPLKAIEAGHSIFIILYFVTSIPVAVYAMNLVASAGDVYQVLDSPWIRLIIQYPYILLSTWLVYVVLIHLMRIPLINKLFTYSTLTHLYRRYHEPDTKLKDIRIPR
jgi:ferredoxin